MTTAAVPAAARAAGTASRRVASAETGASAADAPEGAVTIAITIGEPAGVGPEIALEGARVASLRSRVRPVLIGDGRLLAARARSAGIVLPLVAYARDQSPPRGAVEVVDLPVATACVPGLLDAANGPSVLAWLDRAIDGALSGEFSALVTAPVQKSVINDAGVAFSGHTEYLAARTGTSRVVMMLAGPTRRDASADGGAGAAVEGGMLRVALATTHLALKDVPAAITRGLVLETLRIVERDLRERFGIARPRILVTGLNPHAGEGGYLGREEIDVIGPAIVSAKTEGIDARGPMPADTLFQPRWLDDCDAVVAMYHDQGLPVLKYATFGRGINVTLGLPIVRTSVDHGTALDLAARPDPMRHIDAGSMHAAIEVAVSMALTCERPSPFRRRL